MSRGLGSIQKAILRRVETAPPPFALQFNELCWSVATAAGVSGSELPRAFYAGFQRAVGQLAGRQKVVVEKRKLHSLEEVIRHYPYRTRETRVRDMRLRLLPTIPAYLEVVHPKFTHADVERKHIGQLQDSDLALLKERWIRLEAQVLSSMGSLSDDHRRAACHLVAKGSELFGGLPGPIATPFGSFLEQLQPAFPTMNLDALYWEFFPRVKIAPLTLKTRLYSVIAAGRSGNSAVHKSFKAYLEQTEPTYVRQLPGHVPSHPRGWNLFATFSPEMDKLMRRDVFGSFLFLRIPESPLLPT